jgi:hypothetical protein
LAWYSFVYCLFAGALATADCLSAEKREDTLGLLFLTDLRGYDVILGKLVASAMSSVFGLAAMLPVLALPLLMGGVQWTDFLRIVLSLCSTLMLSLAVGLLTSVSGRSAFRTGSAALVIMAALGFGLPLLSLWFEHGLKWHALARWLQPASPFFLHRDAFYSAAWFPSNQFKLALLCTWVMTLGALALSCWMVTLAWREGGRRSFWTRVRHLVSGWSRWKYGGAQSRRRLRERLLTKNPFAWLAGREIVSSSGVLLLITHLLLYYVVRPAKS